jgi:two-component sensor histidine kinase
LCSQLLCSFGSTATRVRVEKRIAAIALTMEQACGLIINELVSNALKHGFPAGRAGSVMG